MRVSASNIGWKKEYDDVMYAWMRENGVHGLEIAPTRIFETDPYDRCDEASEWTDALKGKFGLTVSSMQSIWYGRKENMFSSEQERQILIEYTKKAIDFAHAIGCGNLVFGCPRNRNVPEGADKDVAVEFFGILGDYAAKNDTILSMEANPPLYNTNFCNTTLEAADLVRKVGSRGFGLNLDVGTMIANEETVEDLKGIGDMINHVHISEPGLKTIQKRKLHNDLLRILNAAGYDKYISLEIGTQDDTTVVTDTISYIGDMIEGI